MNVFGLLLLQLAAGLTKLSDLWVGKAIWQFHAWLNETSMPDYDGWNSGEGLSLVAQNGTWFLFSREVYWNQTSYCSFNGNALLGSVVRKSIDQGRSWSPATRFLTPLENTPYECMGGDGGAFFDAAKETWHYLYQCLDRRGIWNGVSSLSSIHVPVRLPHVAASTRPRGRPCVGLAAVGKPSDQKRFTVEPHLLQILRGVQEHSSILSFVAAYP